MVHTVTHTHLHYMKPGTVYNYIELTTSWIPVCNLGNFVFTTCS